MSIIAILQKWHGSDVHETKCRTLQAHLEILKIFHFCFASNMNFAFDI